MSPVAVVIVKTHRSGAYVQISAFGELYGDVCPGGMGSYGVNHYLNSRFVRIVNDYVVNLGTKDSAAAGDDVGEFRIRPGPLAVVASIPLAGIGFYPQGRTGEGCCYDPVHIVPLGGYNNIPAIRTGLRAKAACCGSGCVGVAGVRAVVGIRRAAIASAGGQCDYCDGG